MQLRRTVPFISDSIKTNHLEKVLLIDKAEILGDIGRNTALKKRIYQTLTLAPNHQILSTQEAEQIVLDQYSTCLEFIYSHPY